MTETVRRSVLECGVSLQEVARQTGINVGNLSRFCRGQRGLTLDNLDRLCEFLGLRIVKDEP